MDIAILGASGYGGGELLRLLAGHPRLRSVAGASRQHVGKDFGAVHPHLRGLVRGAFVETPDWRALAQCERPVLFAALPHGEFAKQLPTLEAAWQRVDLAERLTVIDLSGDFRLADAAAFRQSYGGEHPCPERLPDFVYGLSEWRREALRGARRIANPGCFATALQLGLLPLARLGPHSPPWVSITAVTGSSGSGASPSDTTHHPTRANDLRAYKVLAHQHEGEVRRTLDEQRAGIDFAFVPQSAPLVRGIFASIAFPAPGLERATLRAAFEHAYGDARFVRLVDGTPRVAAVAGSNFADIAVEARAGSACVLVAIDNLVKGMAGQAIQNLNLALGWEEDLGLRIAGVFP
ncbi:MAG: N-acetyl-gamma-glutamyl-phosphate reductase [Xanthomonadales bacterium]|nr:[LysW]-L-2-aminoadipate 6-phosphate reductase [Xanthomonadales bacterium]MCC6594232.1 N-acetyl-gamma-glutamyl-phosphate reductase [Xanthomonadales bacterium]MCE7930835.1 N-acetyl-gamma-glutamyl-phosphate reductase [Xanthomonadales bacterium PRO6]